MGQWVLSAAPDDVLVSIGLGSCIGLALVEPTSRVAVLAHIMLPEAPEGQGIVTGDEVKFADRAVPFVLERLQLAGAVVSDIRAAVVGGAKMFSFNGGSGLDIGARNEQAVLAELDRAGVRVHAKETGGGFGRSIRVHVGDGRVTVKPSGLPEFDLFGGAA